VGSSGASLTGASRYLQFTVRATTSDNKQTPIVKDVTMVFTR
jgi:hypothetical protein